MLFNSIVFAVFFVAVFFIYWFVLRRNLRLQNLFLLAASYFFYGWWDWRFLGLLICLSLFNYVAGLMIGTAEAKVKQKVWLAAGLVVNISVLAVFKYFNFFINSFIDLVSLFGYELPRYATGIILPLGISFYLFLSMSYLLEIYRKEISACRYVPDVMLSLSFFPVILAGPIQRPSTLIPQIQKERTFSYDRGSGGLKQILWGLFTKVVIADNLAFYVNDIFLNHESLSGSTLALGIVFYTLQIYADFSGYSDMAIGVARLLGFDLMRNFAYPYFSRDITEFWKRWHISLTTWFRDFVFLPLSFAVSWRVKGERVLLIKRDLFIYIIAAVITWLLTGLWHGANYTFIVWGMIHGTVLIIYQWQRNPRKKLFSTLGIRNNNRIVITIETIITLVIVMIAWVFFRSETLGQAWSYLAGIFNKTFFSLPQLPEARKALILLVFALLFLVAEWKGRERPFPLAPEENEKPRVLRYAFYYLLLMAIVLFSGQGQQFIYFQF